jgi:arsenite methyltransferase
VLRPGGRVGISDVVAEGDLDPKQRAEPGEALGCAGGVTKVGVELTHEDETARRLHGAIVRGEKPR